VPIGRWFFRVKLKAVRLIETIQRSKNILGQGFPDLNLGVVKSPQQLYLIANSIDALLFQH
jgi:hypothetical protein